MSAAPALEKRIVRMGQKKKGLDNRIASENPSGSLRAAFLEWRDFLETYRGLRWCLGIAIVLVFGLRVIHGNIFLDSEITVLRPEFMHHVWLGSNRFGMVFTSRLFGMNRLVPYLSNALMALTMWALGLFLSFCVYSWSGHSRRYHFFLYVFPLLFVTAPVWAAQYLFVLQSFEISFGILLCAAAVFCTDRFIRNGRAGLLWLAPGLVFMIWSFGTYQVMFSFYICLVLISFMTGYLTGEKMGALECGLKHAAVFLAGCAGYGVLVAITRMAAGTDSSYVSEMVHWNTDGISMCLIYIREEIRRVMAGEGVFYQWFYLPAMCLFVIQAMRQGWKKRKGGMDYFWFLLGGGLLLWSPFFLTVIAGFLQPVRSQLVYPLTAALFLSHLTVLPADENVREGEKDCNAPENCNVPENCSVTGGRTGRSRARLVSAVMTAVCVLCAMRQGVTTVQLFETSWEAYRNDVLTANRIYADLCRTADRSDMSDCLVIFTGGRDAGLAGPAVRGELTGLSFFEAEAGTPVGVTGRVGSLFLTLGLKVQVMTAEQTDLYRQAIEYMKDAPDWPAQGSIRMMGDVAVVRLSE